MRRLALALLPVALAGAGLLAMSPPPPPAPSAGGQAGVPAARAARPGWPLDRDAQRWVDATLAKLTDDELVGQLIVPRFESTFISTDSDEWDRLTTLVRDLHVGGVIAFGGSVAVPPVALNPTYQGVTLGQPLELAVTLNRLQALAAVPLLAGADFEYGLGMRLEGATRFPRAMPLGAVDDPALAREVGRATAVEARAVGIHVNFAPVADVNDNPRNPVINTRSFGEDPARVGALVAAYVDGLQSAGVLGALKHFPGHGNTDVDTHLGLARLPGDRARLDAVELVPFKAGLQAGAAAVMVGHLEVPALDPTPGPATFSGPIVTGVLRQELGFGGLVYSDSLLMDAVARMAAPGEVAVRTLQAGIDVVLDPADPRAAYDGVRQALAAGTLTRARLEASARRVLTAKARLGLHRQRAVPIERVPDHLGTRASRDLARRVAERALTLVKDEQGQVPLTLPRDRAILYLSVLDYPAGWRNAAPSRTLIPELRKRWPRVEAVEVSDRSTPGELEMVRALAARSDALVAGLFVRASSGSGRQDLSPGVARLLQDLAAAAGRRSQPFVAASFGSPYVAAALPSIPAMLLTYDFGDEPELSVVRALAAEAPVRGTLPIALPGLFPIGHGLTRPGQSSAAVPR
jgi:beta-N-acetylhexosaminidase